MLRSHTTWVGLRAVLLTLLVVGVSPPAQAVPLPECADAQFSSRGLQGLCRATCALDCEADPSRRACQQLTREWESRTELDNPCLEPTPPPTDVGPFEDLCDIIGEDPASPADGGCSLDVNGVMTPGTLCVPDDPSSTQPPICLLGILACNEVEDGEFCCELSGECDEGELCCQELGDFFCDSLDPSVPIDAAELMDCPGLPICDGNDPETCYCFELTASSPDPALVCIDEDEDPGQPK